jgi:23S rRNA pseudouridine1911/1915/1917 synthase
LHPHRSAAADAHDPPLRVVRFVSAEALCLRDLLGEIARRLADSPASAERALWHGGIHVNERPLDGDAPPSEVPAGARIAVYALLREPEPVPFADSRVLHDGDGLVAVDKPAWLPMQRTRASARFSLEAVLRVRLGDGSLVAAHRLDRQTSGVALFARGRRGAWAARELAERRVAKRYLALVAPSPERDDFEVAGWIARVPDPARFRFALLSEAAPRARASRTRFHVLGRAAGRALVEALPETGRTHQIRVHLAAAGTPVVGDDLYGSDFAAGAASSAGRSLLHAASLALVRPGGAALSLEAPLPADFAEALSEDHLSKRTASPTSIAPGSITRQATPARPSGASAARRPG